MCELWRVPASLAHEDSDPSSNHLHPVLKRTILSLISKVMPD